MENQTPLPYNRTIIFVLGLLIGIIIGGAGGVFLAGRNSAREQTAGEPARTAPPVTDSAASAHDTATGDVRTTLMQAVVNETRHFRGDTDAPITIIEFSDFVCGFCGRFATDTLPRLQQQYIDTGLVRFGYQSVAFLSEESLFAAEASECAADQGAFWEYHDLLFEHLASGQRNFNKDNLKLFAQELNLDTSAFNTCLDSQQHTAQIAYQTDTAHSIGIQGTPSFLVNGQPVRGAQPFEVFQRIIEAERAAQGQ